MVADRMKNWAYNSVYWPDGKMYAYREDPSNQTSPFIIGFTTDFRSRSPDRFVANISATAGVYTYAYPNHLSQQPDGGCNIAALPPVNGTVLPPSQTGLLDDGASIWKNSDPVSLKNN